MSLRRKMIHLSLRLLNRFINPLPSFQIGYGTRRTRLMLIGLERLSLNSKSTFSF